MNNKGLLSLTAVALLSLAVVMVPFRSTEQASQRTTIALDVASISLLDTTNGHSQSLGQLVGATGTVIFFTGNDCPVSVAYEGDVGTLRDALKFKGVAVIAVNSNHGDSPRAIRDHAAMSSLSFPIYKDADGRLADKLNATRMSEVALLDATGKLVYQGRLDDRVAIGVVRPKATKHELIDAVDAMLAGHNAPLARTEASGCVISRPHIAAPPAVTYASDIRTMIARYCVACHSPGQIGPMPLHTYEQVAAWSRMILEVLKQDRMPPWKYTAPDPRYGEFLEAPAPTDAAKAMFEKWVKEGTPKGDMTKAPSSIASVTPPVILLSPHKWLIGTPDLILTMPEPVEVAARGVIPYKYVRVLQHLGKERWVEAVEIKPGARSVVHHANVYMSQPAISTVGFEAGERWASYTTGRPPTAFPSGVARRLPQGADLTLEIHYTPDGVPRLDQTRIGIRFARRAPRYEARNIPVGILNFEIPPYASNHEVVATYKLKGNGKIAAFTPHMHYRGKDFRYEAILPDGTVRTLLFVPRYNFNWQPMYVPREMISLPKGTILRATARYDNSSANPNNPDPSARAVFGYQTFEEMMFGFVDLVYDEDVNSPNIRAFREADRKSSVRDMGFESVEAFAEWRQAVRTRLATVEKAKP